MSADLIYGKNAVLELLELQKDDKKSNKESSSNRKIQKVILSKSLNKKFTEEMTLELKQNNILFEFASSGEIDKRAGTEKNQGIIAEVSAYNYASSEEVLANIDNEAMDKKLVLFLDGIKDPRNFGAIIRSAVAFNVFAIIIPDKNSVSVNMTVSKTAVGLENKIKIVKAKNLNKKIDKFKENGFWFYGLDMNGVEISDVKFEGKIALVVGGEEKGISKLSKEKMDFIVKIPMSENAESLNVSVASSIAMFKIMV